MPFEVEINYSNSLIKVESQTVGIQAGLGVKSSADEHIRIAVLAFC